MNWFRCFELVLFFAYGGSAAALFRQGQYGGAILTGVMAMLLLVFYVVWDQR